MLVQSPLPDISNLKSSMDDESSLSDLFAGFKNMIDLQESNLPEASAVMENNWNGLLILSELNNWLKSVGDQAVAFMIFKSMLEQSLVKSKAIDEAEVAFWKPVYEKLGRS